MNIFKKKSNLFFTKAVDQLSIQNQYKFNIKGQTQKPLIKGGIKKYQDVKNQNQISQLTSSIKKVTTHRKLNLDIPKACETKINTYTKPNKTKQKTQFKPNKKARNPFKFNTNLVWFYFD